MPQVIIGAVTETETRDVTNQKTGVVTQFHDVYVASGRDTIRTEGKDNSYHIGENVILAGTFKPGRFDPSKLTFERSGRLKPSQLASLVGVQVAPGSDKQ
jgi:hypothetical protein